VGLSEGRGWPDSIRRGKGRASRGTYGRKQTKRLHQNCSGAGKRGGWSRASRWKVRLNLLRGYTGSKTCKTTGAVKKKNVYWETTLIEAGGNRDPRKRGGTRCDWFSGRPASANGVNQKETAPTERRECAQKRGRGRQPACRQLLGSGGKPGGNGSVKGNGRQRS